jgi:DNA-binding CsgD family transcriptional regulator
VAENAAVTRQVGAAIARISDDVGSITERGRRILQALGRVLHYDAASIALRDPERRIRIPQASAGDVAALHAYWSSPESDAELDRLGLNRPGPPLLHTELPVPAAETVYRRLYLGPAGYRGGLDAALFTADGRHVGHLTLLTAAGTRPTPADRDLLGALTGPIARAVDRLPDISTYAGIVCDVIAGVVLTRTGNTVPLPGLPSDPVLAADSPMVAESAERLATGDPYATFLHPAPGDGADGALLRVTVLDTGAEAGDHLRAAVLISPEPDLRGLSRHDLQVLGLIVAGWEDDERLASALHTTPEDVAETVRRGMQLLDTPSRTGLACRALREGLFLPRRASGEIR